MMNIVLIGYRGTGKTTVAEHLARKLGWTCRDSDQEIERLAGKTIEALFAEQGEAGFRDWETRVLAQLFSGRNQVLALGGGAVLREENRRQIAAAGRVCRLTARPETLLARIQADPLTAARRPNLTAEGGMPEIMRLLEAREPFYRQCSEITVDTEGKSPAEVAEDILARLKLPPRSSRAP